MEAVGIEVAATVFRFSPLALLTLTGDTKLEDISNPLGNPADWVEHTETPHQFPVQRQQLQEDPMQPNFFGNGDKWLIGVGVAWYSYDWWRETQKSATPPPTLPTQLGPYYVPNPINR
ncbi:hypothetical protein N7E81_18990 [Reichenbachiella carrageenanivorans]|nr:hypothetical protein [Reichenbachiella carrageenanivorans]UXX79439.1 hypothetical protein N7E81_18990 [Reichenbachiella carrageenanivorans]